MLTVRVEHFLMEKLVKYFVDSLNEDMILESPNDNPLNYNVYFQKA